MVVQFLMLIYLIVGNLGAWDLKVAASNIALGELTTGIVQQVKYAATIVNATGSYLLMCSSYC